MSLAHYALKLNDALKQNQKTVCMVANKALQQYIVNYWGYQVETFGATTIDIPALTVK